MHTTVFHACASIILGNNMIGAESNYFCLRPTKCIPYPMKLHKSKVVNFSVLYTLYSQCDHIFGYITIHITVYYVCASNISGNGIAVASQEIIWSQNHIYLVQIHPTLGDFQMHLQRAPHAPTSACNLLHRHAIRFFNHLHTSVIAGFP